MKKNKRLQSILLVLVIAIWGAIVYQFFNYSGGEDFNAGYAYDSTPIVSLLDEQQDSFRIVADYRDPFLGKRIKVANQGGGASLAAPGPQNFNPQATPPPNIIYQGYSINNNRITRVRVSLNGKTYTMQPNDKKDQLILKKMAKDSIIVSYQGQSMVIKRQRG
ncbi:MAG: hypothetical protein AAGG75_24825 [Bacteroidota bacterium]